MGPLHAQEELRIYDPASQRKRRAGVGPLHPILLGTLREDAGAGLVLGAQSVPDGLATGLLAGVSPGRGC